MFQIRLIEINSLTLEQGMSRGTANIPGISVSSHPVISINQAEIVKESNNNNNTTARDDNNHKLVAVVPPYDEVAEDGGYKPIRPAPPPPAGSREGQSVTNTPLKRSRDPEQQSHHSYEEISALEIQSQINVSFL